MNKVFSITLATIMAICLFSSIALTQNMEILGAGATFPLPLYTKMFDTYNKNTGVKVNYQGVGSGAGITQLINKTVDFGASDAFMDETEMKKAGADILHIPVALGAVVLTYNLPGNPKLKFSPDTIADIFLGKITQWNDPKIAADNAGISLPDMLITPVKRSDGSGTTYIFSDYLNKISNDWKKEVGVGKSLNLSAVGGKGNAGVAGYVKQLPGAIGYVELIYALQNKMPVASIKNKSGVFVDPTIKSTSLAANIALPADTRASITDTPAKEGYPIAGFTWIIIYKEQNYGNKPKAKAEAVLKMLWWMIHEGQDIAEPLQYAPLPKDAVTKAEALLKSATYGGVKILK
ncbi:TPA: phosphate ABC transporter substrate-binding protein PstS [bacterium]|nr:phosphate ABC transporter substrate-binding protein PstS [bacterium]